MNESIIILFGFLTLVVICAFLLIKIIRKTLNNYTSKIETDIAASEVILQKAKVFLDNSEIAISKLNQEICNMEENVKKEVTDIIQNNEVNIAAQLENQTKLSNNKMQVMCNEILEDFKLKVAEHIKNEVAEHIKNQKLDTNVAMINFIEKVTNTSLLNDLIRKDNN